MIKRIELENYLVDLLKPKTFKDYCPNGLQVEGRDKLSKVSFAVSATIESIEESVKWGSDCLITHHGIIWSYQSSKVFKGAHLKRLKGLILNDMNLLSYHLPLDGHIEHGNAAGMAKEIGLINLEPFGYSKGSYTGVKGELLKPMSVVNFQSLLESKLNREIISTNLSHEVQKVGIITGGANNDWIQAKNEGLDTYITGEISEYNWHDANEENIHFFACGHHATERFGVLSLMNLVDQKFNVQTKFFDSDNPV